MSSDAEKEQFLQTYRERKKKSTIETSIIRALQLHESLKDLNPTDISGSGWIKAKLSDTVDCTVKGFYGADYSALSAMNLQACAEAGVFVQLLPLRSPILVEIALR